MGGLGIANVLVTLLIPFNFALPEPVKKGEPDILKDLRSS